MILWFFNQVVYVEDTRPEVVVVDQPAIVAPAAPAGLHYDGLIPRFILLNCVLSKFTTFLKLVPFLVQPYYVRAPVRGKKQQSLIQILKNDQNKCCT